MADDNSYHEPAYLTIDPELLDGLQHDDTWLKDLLKKMHSGKEAEKNGSLVAVRVKPQDHPDVYKERLVLPRVREETKSIRRDHSDVKRVLKKRSPSGRKADVIFEMYGVERKKLTPKHKKPKHTSGTDSPSPLTNSPSPREKKPENRSSAGKRQNTQKYYSEFYELMWSESPLEQVNALEQQAKLLKLKHAHLRHFDQEYYRQANSQFMDSV